MSCDRISLSSSGSLGSSDNAMDCRAQKLDESVGAADLLGRLWDVLAKADLRAATGGGQHAR